ncbi:hypothetical protein [Enterobacter hormaechei]|uniref:hypothetical protein n=1 Tax=Enterobacter hormaechei TaxID=158836 RepID=UPI0012B8C681|nr:hypothetical protein [Enterobacter hormaechei]
MSNIDKHAVQAVADLKAGYTLGHADVAILNELARIALASLEAKPVCVIDQSNLDYLKSGSDADVWPASRAEMGDVLLYRSATPVPVSVPDEVNVLLNHLEDVLPDDAFNLIDVKTWNNVSMLSRPDVYRSAMLHGAERVTTGNKLPAIGWLRADYQDDNRGLRGNAPLFVLGKKDPSTVWGLDYVPLTSNSPVIPDGVCPCCGRKQLKNRTCSVSGCDEKHIARGFCIKHYAIERKKDPSRRESIRAADKRYRARKAAAPQQEVTAKPKK